MKRIQQAWQAWTAQRFSLHGPKTLKHKDILLFIHQEGLLYVVLLLITFIAGTNYANNLILAVCFLLSSILLLSVYMAFTQLYGLQLQLQHSDMVQVGDPINIKLLLSPKKNTTHVYLRCEYQQQFKKISLLSSSAAIECTEIAALRGPYRLARFCLYSIYPFGLVKAWTYLYPSSVIWVAPQALPFDVAEYGFEHSDMGHTGVENFAQLRSYQSGDPINRISWQHYAKAKNLLIKSFSDQTRQRLIFNYYAMPASTHEAKLGQLMYLVELAHQQQCAFAMRLPAQELESGQGDDQYQAAKLMLAQEP